MKLISLVLIGVCLAPMAAADGHMLLKGKESVVQMHNSFLKVYSQSDLTPSFVGIKDNLHFEAGLHTMHEIVLENVPYTCAGTWGNRPCTPDPKDVDYPAKFYCRWVHGWTNTTAPHVRASARLYALPRLR